VFFVRTCHWERGNDPTTNIRVRFWVTGQKRLGNTGLRHVCCVRLFVRWNCSTIFAKMATTASYSRCRDAGVLDSPSTIIFGLTDRGAGRRRSRWAQQAAQPHGFLQRGQWRVHLWVQPVRVADSVTIFFSEIRILWQPAGSRKQFFKITIYDISTVVLLCIYRWTACTANATFHHSKYVCIYITR